MSTKVTTDLEWNGRSCIKDFDLAQFKSLYQSAALVEGQAKASAPTNKTVGLGGQLRQSITKIVTKDNGIVGTNVFYAPYVEFGTRPHKITAKGKGLTDGKNWFGKSVNHPGTKAQPFLLPALIKNRKKIIEIFRKNGLALKWVKKKRGFE